MAQLHRKDEDDKTGIPDIIVTGENERKGALKVAISEGKCRDFKVGRCYSKQHVKMAKFSNANLWFFHQI